MDILVGVGWFGKYRWMVLSGVGLPEFYFYRLDFGMKSEYARLWHTLDIITKAIVLDLTNLLPILNVFIQTDQFGFSFVFIFFVLVKDRLGFTCLNLVRLPCGMVS